MKKVIFIITALVLLFVPVFKNQAFAILKPTVPINVSATASSRSITVTWLAVSGSTSYDVKLNDDVLNTTETSATFLVVPDTQFSYAVRTNNDAGSSEYSETQYITSLEDSPNAPDDVSATATSRTITITWSAVTKAIGYNVKINGAVINTADTTYVYAAESETLYSYSVCAINSAGTGDYSEEQSITTPAAALAVPTNVRATVTSHTLTVTWTAVGGAKSYNVRINDAVINTTGTSYVYAAAPETQYSYAVCELNSLGTGDYSATQYITTQSKLPTVPTDVKATCSGSIITVTWSEVMGATGYIVKINGIEHRTTILSFSFNATDIKQYSYCVCAVNDGGASEYSAIQYITEETLSVPETPSNVTATATANSVTVTWTAVSGARGYNVKFNKKTEYTTETSITFYATYNTQNSYCVRAVNDAGFSEYSELQFIKTPNRSMPAVPTNVSAKLSITKFIKSITVTWTAVSGAIGYMVCLDQQKKFTAGTSFTFDGTNNAQYSYCVCAVNEEGSGEYSQLQYISTTASRRPAVPTNITASVKDNKLTVSWSAVSGADYYNVKVNDKEEISTETSVEFSVKTFTQYSYAVQAGNNYGTSSFSQRQYITTPAKPSPNAPAVPTNVSATASRFYIYIKWTAVSGATGYFVCVGEPCDNGIKYTKIKTKETEYAFSVPPATAHPLFITDKEYSYAVCAKNEDGCSEYSKAQYITPKYLKPAVPTNVSATATYNSITVTWPYVIDADSYVVKIDSMEMGKSIYGYARCLYGMNSCTITVEPGTVYYYSVKSKNVMGSSDFSSPQEITTPNAFWTKSKKR